jgi:5S rRNA maturation endonuclease (ribonuclease M5)
MIHQEKISQNIEQILEELGINFKRHKNRLSFPCPLHEGNNSNGATIYIDGNGIFKCWTNHCEIEYGKSLINFIRALYSKQNDKEYSIDDTVVWLEKLLNESISEEDNQFNAAKTKSIHIALNLNKSINKEEILIDRQTVISQLNIPADYFLNRGYKKSTLLKYDVGLCVKPGKQMYNRVVAPVYDDNYKYMVGCVGRTQKPKCMLCNKFHLENEHCPTSSIDEYLSSKWINSTGFNGENYLYNFWFAKNFIEKTKTVILVEGAADVWKLEEANINIGLGLFGAHLTDKQSQKLEKLPIINLIIATDNDEAGQKARLLIKEKLWRHYNIFDIVVETKDVGELSIEETKNIFNPILEKLNVF